TRVARARARADEGPPAPVDVEGTTVRLDVVLHLRNADAACPGDGAGVVAEPDEHRARQFVDVLEIAGRRKVDRSHYLDGGCNRQRVHHVKDREVERRRRGKVARHRKEDTVHGVTALKIALVTKIRTST